MEPAPKLRLWTRRPNLNALGSALASLAFSASLMTVMPDAEKHSTLHSLTIWAVVSSMLFGIGLMYRGLFEPVPLVDLEEAWNVNYDNLRNETHRFVRDVVNTQFEAIRNRYPEVQCGWKEELEQIPIPLREGGPLYPWKERLAKHDSPHVQRFYELARACESIIEGAMFRRLAVRTYDVYYRARATREGFRDWMIDQEVEAGAEPILMLAAYMEVVRSDDEKSGRTPTHIGFWLLAKEWHHDNTLRLSTAKPKQLR